MKRPVLAVVLLISAAAPSGAQLLELQPGARVSVLAPSILGGRLDATVAARRGDTISVVRLGTGAVDVPISAMTSVSLYRGKSHGAGAIRGLILEECAMYTDAGLVASTTLGSALIGAGIGAIVGRAHWDKLQLPVRSAIVVPSKGRAGIGFGFRF